MAPQQFSASTAYEVSVIIPTACTRERHSSLLRAINSVLGQRAVTAKVIVVVNGTLVDAACYRALCALSEQRLQIRYLKFGNLPRARRHGRSLVTTPFFAFLDDDDEYLGDALWRRLQPLAADPTLDYVVTNGYHRLAGRDDPAVRNIAAIKSDPLRALLAENWLASCGGLYRSACISLDYFDGRTHYYEWTKLAYQLAASAKMLFLDTPTYRIHDSPSSLSKSSAYRYAHIGVLREILALELPEDVKYGLRIRLGQSYHGLSNVFRRNGDLKRAWRYHLTSLGYPEGYRYLPYSRRLLPFFAKRLVARTDIQTARLDEK